MHAFVPLLSCTTYLPVESVTLSKWLAVGRPWPPMSANFGQGIGLIDPVLAPSTLDEPVPSNLGEQAPTIQKGWAGSLLSRSRDDIDNSTPWKLPHQQRIRASKRRSEPSRKDDWSEDCHVRAHMLKAPTDTIRQHQDGRFMCEHDSP